MRGGLSCRQVGSFSPGQFKAIAEEFHEVNGFGGSCEKLRKGMAEGNSHDLFRGDQSGPNGTDPGAEGLPYQLGFRRREDLKEALGDQSELDVTMISRCLLYTSWHAACRREAGADSRSVGGCAR